MKLSDLDINIQNLLKTINVTMRMASESELSVYDVFKVIGLKGNEKRRLKKFQHIVESVDIKLSHVIAKWSLEDNDLKTTYSTVEIPMIKWEDIHKLVVFTLNSSHVSNTHQSSVLKIFGLDESAMSSVCIPNTEKNIMEHISRSIPLEVYAQFPIGRYKLDLYFPGNKIAVECDEFGHGGYDNEKDDLRTTFVSNQLNCTWVRFDPYEDGFSIFEVVGRIVSLLFKLNEHTVVDTIECNTDKINI